MTSRRNRPSDTPPGPPSEPADGLVTSAPAPAAVGSLLTDLLHEAQREVHAEREKLQQRLDSIHSQEEEAKRRNEARERDRLQRKLIEETRRRNETLTRHERAALAAMESPQADIGPLAAVAPSAVAMPDQPPARPAASNRWTWVAAAALIVVAAGTSAVLALQQPGGMSVPTVAGVADNAITHAKLQLAKGQIDDNRSEAARATKALKQAEATARQAQARAEQERELRRAQEEKLLKVAPKTTQKPTTIRRTGRRGPKSPKINTDYFSEPKKRKK